LALLVFYTQFTCYRI